MPQRPTLLPSCPAIAGLIEFGVKSAEEAAPHVSFDRSLTGEGPSVIRQACDHATALVLALHENCAEVRHKTAILFSCERSSYGQSCALFFCAQSPLDHGRARGAAVGLAKELISRAELDGGVSDDPMLETARRRALALVLKEGRT